MNRERIETLADHIGGLDRDQFDMSHYWFSGDIGSVCRSPACVAGHAVALFSDDAEVVRAAKCGTGPTHFQNWTHSTARKNLGLLGSVADELFTPNEEVINYHFVTNYEAAQVLRHLAATGNVAWEKFYCGPVGAEL